jgi:hypothetical protein
MNTVRALKSRRKNKHRWVHSLEQEYFTLTRNHSYQMLKQQTGKGPEHWRTIRFGTYNQLKDMEWIVTYNGEDQQEDSRMASTDGGGAQAGVVNSRDNDVCFNNDRNSILATDISSPSCRVGIG